MTKRRWVVSLTGQRLLGSFTNALPALTHHHPHDASLEIRDRRLTYQPTQGVLTLHHVAHLDCYIATATPADTIKAMPKTELLLPLALAWPGFCTSFPPEAWDAEAVVSPGDGLVVFAGSHQSLMRSKRTLCTLKKLSDSGISLLIPPIQYVEH